MRTEKAISCISHFISNMRSMFRDKNNIFAEYTTGNADFDTYLQQLEKEIQNYEEIDPYKKEPMKQLDNKVNDFLVKHASISYHDFKMIAQPDSFETDDYRLLPKRKNLRKRLFDYRAKMLIAALANSESLVSNLDDLIRTIKDRKIPYIKNDANEPTFMAIAKILEK